MNDDRKFKERAETMKELFLAQIKADVIAEVVGISSATVSLDRARVEKLYGIKIPKTAISSLEFGKRFNLLFSIYVKYSADIPGFYRRTPLVKAAELSLNIERFESRILGMQELWNNMLVPQISPTIPNARNYKEFIDDCWRPEKRYLLKEFYTYLAKDEVLLESIKNENMVLDCASKFVANQNRESLTTLMISDLGELKQWLSTLDYHNYAVIEAYYGLTTGEKMSLQAIADKYGLSRERIRQIREKSLRLLSTELKENYLHLVSSTAKTENLESDLQVYKEKYQNLCKDTDIKIAGLMAENKILSERLKGIDIQLEEGNFQSLIVNFLAMKLEDTDIDHIIARKFYDLEYVVDFIENWSKLIHYRSVGKKTLRKIDNFLHGHGIKRDEVKIEEITLARRIIQRKSI